MMSILTKLPVRFFALLIIGLVFAGCDSVVDEEPNFSVAPAVAYDLEVGNSLQIDGDATVAFVELISDSRCPLEDICEYDGSVEASFTIEMDGKKSPFILSGYVGPEGEGWVRFDVGPYKVTLERLDPYPMEDCDMDMPPVAKLRFIK